MVIGFGGGSALDAGKAIAALAANGGDPLRLPRGRSARGQPLATPSLPFVAIPTTAGTGSEVTKNAVLALAGGSGVKASLRSPLCCRAWRIVDPDLLAGCPPAVLAASGLDALSQLIEPLSVVARQPAHRRLAREGIRRSARRCAARSRAAPVPTARRRREALALASLFGGLCLANAGLGAVHGFAAPLGGMFAAPHGAVCAALLPAGAGVNAARAARPARRSSPALARFDEVARAADRAARTRAPEDGSLGDGAVRGARRSRASPGTG